MPIISRFMGIIIRMFFDEHNPPHFHAEYGEFRISIDIQNAQPLKGRMPNKQLKMIEKWCIINQDELLKNWNLLTKEGHYFEIKPLDVN